MSDEPKSGNAGGTDDGLGTAQGWAFGFGAGAVVLALLMFAYMIGFNRGEEEAGRGDGQTVKPAGQGEAAQPASAGPGEDLFVQSCGSCHTLAAAETSGTTGPDLDGLAPDAPQVQAAMENGGTGSGAMPAGLLEGQDAEAVAEYVGASAGR